MDLRWKKNQNVYVDLSEREILLLLRGEYIQCASAGDDRESIQITLQLKKPPSIGIQNG